MEWRDQVWDRVDAAVGQWERSLHAAEPGQFQRVVPTTSDPARTEVLVTLVKIDQEQRWAAGKRCPLEYYLDQWPELRSNLQRMADLVAAECRTRMASGEIPNLPDLKMRFPACADRAWKIIVSEVNTGAGRDDRTSLVADRPASAEDDTVTQPHDERVLLPAGARMGRYRIIKRLGRGGMGTVYLAEDEELEREVALKVLHSWVVLASPGRDLLLEEAKKVARLNHPSIVPVFDAGRAEDGTTYFVMEYVEGESLAERIARGGISIEQATDWGTQLAAALQYAHQRGFVHRDIKPANVVIDCAEHARLMDFGLAIHESEQLRRAGEDAGTLAYMAPEHVRGKTHLLDGRADIWSLGVVLYEMLTGQRPFHADSREELREAILKLKPKPLRQKNNQVPADLEAVCLRCLRKYASERYTSASELAEALARCRQPQGSGVLQSGVVGLIAVVAVGVLLFVFAQRETLAPDSPATSLESVTEEPWEPGGTASVARHIDGFVDVHVFNKTDTTRSGLSIYEPAARPLRHHDMLRVNAKLEEPAYIYLIWISADGNAAPIYPWTPGKWDDDAKAVEVDRISLPENADHGWPITGRKGMETVLLLARREPLPDDVDLQSLLADLPAQPMQDPRALVWFKNGEVVSGAKSNERTRGPQWFDEQRIDDPVYRTQRQIYERLQDHFELIVANSVAFGGTAGEEVP